MTNQPPIVLIHGLWMTPEGRSHFIFAQDGWEEVADDALDWAMDHLAAARETGTGRQEPA